MTAPLFLVDAGALAGMAPGASFVLDGPEGRHAATVRRIGLGEHVQLADGQGTLATGEVSDAQASATSAARGSEPASTVTRRPVGNGWSTRSWLTSSSWCWLSTRITPDWRSISSSARRGTRVVRTACPGGTT